MIELILKIYIGINCFIAGHYFNHSYNTSYSTTDKLATIMWAVNHIVFAIPIIIFTIIWLIIEESIIKPIDATFQLRFWFKFMFTDNWKNVNQEALYNLNEEARKRGVKKFKDRSFKYGVIWINELNKYEHKPEEQHDSIV